MNSKHPGHLHGVLHSPASTCWRIALTTVALIATTAMGQPVITEFMASNDSTLPDETGAFPDWIEIHNPGSDAVSLAGWFVTDDAADKTKWQFPAVTLAAGGYLIVYASDEDRTDPAANLHANFKLTADGEYLGLIEPDGMTIASEFSPEFPGQSTDISYGWTQPTDPAETPQRGFFPAPTPGAPNGGGDSLLILDEVVFSHTSGPFAEDFLLTLTGASADQKIHFVLNPPNPYGVSVGEVTTNQPLYPGPIPMSDSAVIRAAIFSADGQRRGPMSTHHYLRIDNESTDRVDTFSSQLPIIVFDNHGFGPMEKDGNFRYSWLYAFWNEGDDLTNISSSPDVAAGLELEVRGQTSADFLKKSYRFDLLDHFGLSAEYDLAGGGSFNEWAVIGPWATDRSYIRNVLVYGLSNAMGRWAADTRLVEAFFNWDGDALELSDYVGIYVITDQLEVEAGRVEIEPLGADDHSGEDITGGYFIEIDGPDEGKFGWKTNNGNPTLFTSTLQLDYPKEAALTTAQAEYITDYIQRMEDALLAGRAENWANRSYLQYLDRASWINYHLLNVWVKNVDAFWRGAKFTKDRNEKLVAGPVWDFNRSLESFDDRDNSPTGWDAEWVEFFDITIDYWEFEWWGLIARDPEFMQGWFDRWQELRDGPFANAAFSSRIDELAAEIGDAAATRDVDRWPPFEVNRRDLDEEMSNIRNWMEQRSNWIDGMLAPPPSISQNPDGSITATPAAGTELIYTMDGADPRLRGGAIAPDALRSSETVTFPAGSNFRLRSYHPLLDHWPGTKWSRAFPGSIGSPFHPSPRLANLSSRALVEGGDNVLISGLVINDADQKQVLLRGIGPTLAEFGVTGSLTEPVLTVYDAQGAIVNQNTSWGSGDNAAAIAATAERVGAFPLADDSNDSAMLLDLPAGRYTVHLGSSSDAGGTGLIEAYEIDDIGALTNLSVRGSVTGSTAPLIAGFVVSGDQPKRVLVRGVGPTLADFGVTNFVPNPSLRVESGGETIITNDDWQQGDSDLVTAANPLVGAFDLNDDSQDAALVVTLPPGVYTAVITGADDEPGLALVEVYEIE